MPNAGTKNMEGHVRAKFPTAQPTLTLTLTLTLTRCAPSSPRRSGCARTARTASVVATGVASASRPAARPRTDSASVVTRRVLEIVSDLAQNTIDDDKRLNHQLRASSFNWSQMLRLKSEALQSIGSDPTEGARGAGM